MVILVPTISVIVPIYKVEKYLERCVNSILAQTYTDFELILVDDGSPDLCGKICDEYAEKDRRVSVIHKKNGGLSDARNAGLDIAKGNYILFVDSDDYIELNLIETAMQYLEKEPDALVGFGYTVLDENGVKLSEYLGRPLNVVFNTEERVRFICNELSDYQIAWSSWSKFYNRQIIEKHHIRFVDNKKIFAEDLYFSLCYFPFVEKFINIPKPLYNYLQRNDSIMGVDIHKKNFGRFEQLAQAVYEFYKSNESCKDMLKLYPLVYFKILKHAFQEDNQLAIDKNMQNSRNRIHGEISNPKTFKKYMRKAWKYRDYLHNSYEPIYASEENLNIYRYYSDGNMLFFKIRNKLIYKKYWK